MTTHRLHRLTETPDDLVTATATTAAPLIVVTELRGLAANAGHGRLNGRGGRLWLTPGQLQRRANQLGHTGGGDRR
jgi:hypothetical protein